LTSVARNIMRQALFPQHPYALRSNGSVEAVQHLTQKDLVDFRDRYVVAKNGVIYVFGDVKAAEVKQLIEETLGKMQPGALALTDAKPSTPLSKSETVESRKDKAQGVLMVGFRGASLSSPDRYALELIDEASSDLGSRFFIRIREQMGLAYYVGASEMQGLVPGLFAFYLGTDPQKIEPVKAAFLDEIHKLANEGLTPVEAPGEVDAQRAAPVGRLGDAEGAVTPAVAHTASRKIDAERTELHRLPISPAHCFLPRRIRGSSATHQARNKRSKYGCLRQMRQTLLKWI